MGEYPSSDFNKLRSTIAAAFQAHWKLFLVQGVLMMGLGLLAVAVPHISTLAVEVFVGWLFFIGGIFRTLTVLRIRHMPGFWWSLLTAVVAVALGLVLIAQPAEGVLTLTMVLLVLFIVEGIAAILIALDFRRHLRNWGWTLFSGIVDLVLAYLIWQGWPGTAAWAIGLLVGINMFFLGASIAMIAIAARSMGNGSGP